MSCQLASHAKVWCLVETGQSLPKFHPSCASSLISKNKINAGRNTSSTQRRKFQSPVYDPNTKIDFPLEEIDGNSEISASPPPTAGRFDIVIDNDTVRSLDLGPARTVLEKYIESNRESSKDAKELLETTVGFKINYKFDDPLDPREFSESPEIRLWFVRLDAAYPWLPAVLDWRGGELARYSAMLVPHQMSRRLGLVFNPEALELWAMNKLFVTYDQLKQWDVQRADVRCRDMMKMLGFSVSDELFKAVDSL